MFGCGGSGYVTSVKATTLGIDEGILEELRLMYPDASEEHLEQAARSHNVDEAFDKLSHLIGMGAPADVVANNANADSLRILREFFEPSDGGISKYDESDLVALLAAFSGDHDACCGISMAEPHLIDRILRTGCTIDQAAQRDAEEKESVRKAKAYERAVEEAREIQKRRESDAKEKAKYLPPSITKEQWNQYGQELLELATPQTREVCWTGQLEQGEVPRCWDGTHGVVSVEMGNKEYETVAAYLAGCIGYQPEIRGIKRVQNYQDFGEFRSDNGDTIMFHGCRAGSGGEQSIAMDGFQISKAMSVDARTGNRKGSWFAYRAEYSDGGGFVFEDTYGLRHIFLCIVSTVDVLHNITTMRVVGQHCAVPLWIVTYSKPGRFKC